MEFLKTHTKSLLVALAIIVLVAGIWFWDKKRVKAGKATLIPILHKGETKLTVTKLDSSQLDVADQNKLREMQAAQVSAQKTQDSANAVNTAVLYNTVSSN